MSVPPRRFKLVPDHGDTILSRIPQGDLIALYGMKEWIEPKKPTRWSPPRSHFIVRALGRILRQTEFVVEAQVEPAEGDSLDSLAIELSAPLGLPVSAPSGPGDRAIYLHGTHWDRTPRASLERFHAMLSEKAGHVDVSAVAIRVTPVGKWKSE